jgi:hypothetical protein
MALTPAQNAALLAPLDPGRVQSIQGQSHLTAWDVRRWLIRIFGVGGWDFAVISCELVHAWTGDVARKRSGQPTGETYVGHTVVYRALGRLVIKDAAGRVVAAYEDGATGDSVNQPSIGDAHDHAMKTALSQALKRCAVNLGDQFGLSLYNSGATGPVVLRSLAMTTTAGDAPTDLGETHVDGDTEAGPAPADNPPPAATDPAWLAAIQEEIAGTTEADTLRALWTSVSAERAAGRVTDADRDDLHHRIKDAHGRLRSAPPGAQAEGKEGEAA